MTARAAFRQADLERIFKAAKAADTEVRVELEPNGKVVIIPIRPGDAAPEPKGWFNDA